MTFTSLQFFVFCPIIFLVFYFTPDRWRWLVLLIASYGFYASFRAPYLLGVLFMVTIISYACGLRIISHQDEAGRKRWLQIGVIACIAILALLKYLPFLEIQASSLLGLNSTKSTVIISIGVSYFVFQAISYLADIYLEIEEPEKHFGYYSVYLAFFPKLLQGPIERSGDLLPQLKQPFKFEYDAVRSGIFLFTSGLFKKIVIADRFALCADQVFNNLHNYSGWSLIVGTYAYAFQIFFDFSAYTDMARGLGRIFGIKLTENFNSPYLATSIADFWRRWHISFSRWILDYIFKPLQLGWRNWGNSGTAVALIVTFFVSGVWHGASWNFVIWGLLHGIYLAASTYYKPYQKRIYKSLKIDKLRFLRWWQIVVTFNLVSVAWIFFRSRDIKEACYVLLSIFDGTKGIAVITLLSKYSVDAFIIMLALVLIALNNKIKHQIVINNIINTARYNGMLCFINSAIYGILFYLMFFCGVESKSFIYFQF